MQKLSPTKPTAIPRPSQSARRDSSDTPPSLGGGLLGDLKVWQKLALIIVLAVIPITYLLYAFFTAQNAQIQFAEREQEGAEYLTVSARLLHDLPLHRNLASVTLAGDPSYAEKRDQTVAAIREDFKALAEVDQKYGQKLQTNSRVARLQESWGQLVSRTDTLSAEASFDQHTKIIDEQLKPLVRDVATNSNLILDPDLEAYTAVDLVVNNLLTFTEEMSRLSGLGAIIFSRKSVTSQQRFDMAYYTKRSEELDSAMFPSIQTITRKFSDVGATLKADNDAGQISADRLRELVRTKIIAANAINYDHRDFFTTGSRAVEAHIKLLDDSLIGLQGILQERIDGLRRSQLTSAAVTGLALALLAFVTTLIVLAITRPVGSMVRVIEKFGRGDLSETVNVHSRDELGLLASSFNQSIVQLRDLVTTEAERDDERRKREELQANIGDFLNVTMDISQGDLTRKGKVSEDILGNVVDAINVMTEEIGYLLKDVSNTADRVLSGSNQMTAVNDHIAQSTEGQARLAEQARARAVEVTQSIRAMAQGAAQTAQAAQQTLLASQQGQIAVNETLGGMEGVRREMQFLTEGVQSLSERSSEIQSIVKTIANFASQTNLLALSAALEAAGAGESGRRFATVADQVRKLADESTRATQQITGLIKGFESDIQGLSQRAEGSTREVEQGYKVATQAGERLQEIAQLAQQSAALVQGISKVTQQQVSNVEQVSRAAQVIATTASQTGQESAKGRQAAEDLRQLSEQLTSNLSRFRLPGA